MVCNYINTLCKYTNICNILVSMHRIFIIVLELERKKGRKRRKRKKRRTLL